MLRAGLTSTGLASSTANVMPKLYEYFGLLVMFYSNEHEPVHVDGKCQGREMRAELIIVNGLVVDVSFMNQPGRLPLSDSEIQFFKEIVVAKSDDIVRKWVDFFVLHNSIVPEVIKRRLK